MAEINQTIIPQDDLENLRKAQELVATWPEWKRNIRINKHSLARDALLKEADKKMQESLALKN